MSDGTPPAVPAGRPWWGPLLSVGSLGLGGMQGLSGLFLLYAATRFTGPTAGAFLLMGLAWLLPGVALAAGGVGLLAGARWGRRLSVIAVLLGAGGVGLVAARRASIPPAMADGIELATRVAREQKSPLADILEKSRQGPAGDPVVGLRDPGQASVQGWFYTAYCCCPVLPWYILVLVACIPAWGRRLERDGAPKAS